MALIVPITPVPKPRMTRADRYKKRPAVLRYWEFKDSLRSYLPEYEMSESLSVTFVLPMPKSWPEKKKKAMSGQPHRQRPDLDNLIKSYMDSLAEEDSHVHTFYFCRKIWGYEGSIRLGKLQDN